MQMNALISDNVRIDGIRDVMRGPRRHRQDKSRCPKSLTSRYISKDYCTLHLQAAAEQSHTADGLIGRSLQNLTRMLGY